MATGIKDKVAILGMGCSKFGERWECGAEELMVEAYLEALQRCGRRDEPDPGRMVLHCHRRTACRQGRHAAVGGAAPAQHSRHARREFLRQRLGSISRRGLCGGCGRLRHRAGARCRETEGHGLRRPAAAREARRLAPLWAANGSAPGNFAQLASAYRAKHGVSQGRSETRHRACLGEEPRQRREESQGASAEGDHRRTCA